MASGSIAVGRPGARWYVNTAALALLGAAPCMPALALQAAAAPAKSATHTVTYDKYSLLIDGKRIYLWSGSFHYWRLPSPSLWKDVLQKMKAAGYNGVEI